MSVQLDHVAVGLRSLADAPSFAVGVLGGTPLGAGPGNGFRWAQWSYEGGGVLEFLEPAGPPGGFLHRFLDARGPGVHHVTFKVPDLASYAARAGRLGFEVVGYDDRFAGWKECFLHPRSAQGTVVQMAEVHPEADEFAGLPFEWPASPPRAEPPARVLGLRLAARNAAATRKLFVELLGGACEEGPGGLHLRWPDSPLEIAVRLEPAAATEGPRAVEVACARRLALPEGPYPLLGAAFVQVEGAP